MIVAQLFHERGIFLKAVSNILKSRKIPDITPALYFQQLKNVEQEISSKLIYVASDQAESYNVDRNIPYALSNLAVLQNYGASDQLEFYNQKVLEDFEKDIDYQFKRYLYHSFDQKLTLHTIPLPQTESLRIQISTTHAAQLEKNDILYAKDFSGNTDITKVIDEINTFLRKRIVEKVLNNLSAIYK